MNSHSRLRWLASRYRIAPCTSPGPYAGRVPIRSAKATSAVITTAHRGRTEDRRNRVRTYLVSMTLRVLCIIGALVVPNTAARLIMIAGAGFLPAVAVLLANAVDRRRHQVAPLETGFPEYRHALMADQVIPHDDSATDR